MAIQKNTPTDASDRMSQLQMEILITTYCIIKKYTLRRFFASHFAQRPAMNDGSRVGSRFGALFRRVVAMKGGKTALYETLKRNILTMELAPDQDLDEVSLSEGYGISR